MFGVRIQPFFSWNYFKSCS